MVVVADLLATLRLDANRFTTGARQAETAARNMGTKVTQQTSKIDDGFKKANSRLMGFVATLASVATVKALVNIGVQSEAMGLRYHAVFGEMADDLDSWVVAHQQGFGMAKDDLQGYLAKVANMMTPLGLALDASADLSTQVLEVANAWSLFSGGAYSVEDASDRIVKGLMGQARGLIDMGMRISETALEQEMLNLGAEDLTGTEKELAEVQARLNIIMGASGPAFQVAEDAMGGAAGNVRSLTAAWKGFLDTLGGHTTGEGAGTVITAAAATLNLISGVFGNMEPLEGMWAGAWSGMAESTATQAAHAAEAAAENAERLRLYYTNLALTPQQLFATLQRQANQEMVGRGLAAMLGYQYEQVGPTARQTAVGARARVGDDIWAQFIAQYPELARWAPSRPAISEQQFGAPELFGGSSLRGWAPSGDSARFLRAMSENAAEMARLAEWAVLQTDDWFGRLPGMIASHAGDVGAATAELIASFGTSLEYTRNLDLMEELGFGRLAADLRALGDSPETRAAAAYYVSATGRAMAEQATFEMAYFQMVMAFEASPAYEYWQAVTDAYEAQGEAMAAALLAGYGNPQFGIPGVPGVPSGAAGDAGDEAAFWGRGVPNGGPQRGATVSIGMVIGDDAAVDKAVSTALRRARQRGG